MVKRVFGKVDGIEVNYDHSKGDWWNVPVPLDIDGEYGIEVIAEDEAGNQSFITRLLYTVKGENICVHQLPLSGYLFDSKCRWRTPAKSQWASHLPNPRLSAVLSIPGEASCDAYSPAKTFGPLRS